MGAIAQRRDSSHMLPADMSASTGAEGAQYLTFMLGGEVFAIGILAIKEIIEYSAPTNVPMMPASVRGVINLRGTVVPVVDLQRRFERPSSPVTKRSCIVIVEVDTGTERQVIGIVVDAVNAVLEMAPENIEPAPSFGARIRTDFIAGMGKVDGRFVILLNTQQVLSIDELASASDASLEAAAVA